MCCLQPVPGVNTDADNVAAMASVMIDFCNFILGYPLNLLFKMMCRLY